MALWLVLLPIKQRFMGSNPDITSTSVALLSFLKFTCEIIFQIYHELCREGNHREVTCTPAWELYSKSLILGGGQIVG